MDISSLSNASVFQANTNIQKEESTTTAFQNKLQSASKSGTDAELMEACKSFESYFMQMMFKEMRKTSFSTDDTVSGGSTGKMYQEMLDEEVAKNSTEAGGIGLATFMYKQMQREKRAEEIL